MIPRLAAACLLPAALALPARGGEGVAAAVLARGTVPIRGETRLVIEGLEGEILLVSGAAAGLRFSSTSFDRRPVPLPVAIWRESATLRLARPEGAAALPRRIRVEIPEGIGSFVLASDSTVSLSGVRNPIRIQGNHLTVSGVALVGPIELLVEGGKVELREVAGSVDLRGAGLEFAAEGTGPVSLALDGGKAELKDIRGRLDAEVYAVDLRAEGVAGPAVLSAAGGSILAAGLRDESVLTLRRTPLELRECAGDVDITTDAEVRFSEQRGPLHVDSYGGAVVGRGARNLLEVRCQGALVDVADVAGAVRMQGDGLTIRLKGVTGETLVYVGSSDVTIEDVTGPLSVESESGILGVQRAKGPVEITSRKDDVVLEGLAGTLRLDAEGPAVRVGWASLPKAGESLVKNRGGGAVLTFPDSGEGLVEARAETGNVESDVPGVVVDATGSAASGAIGGGGEGVVRVLANGDIRLLRTVRRRLPPLVDPRPGSPRSR